MGFSYPSLAVEKSEENEVLKKKKKIMDLSSIMVFSCNICFLKSAHGEVEVYVFLKSWIFLLFLFLLIL